MCRLRYNGIATGEVYVSYVSPRLSAHQAGAQSDGRRMEEFVNFLKFTKAPLRTLKHAEVVCGRDDATSAT